MNLDFIVFETCDVTVESMQSPPIDTANQRATARVSPNVDTYVTLFGREIEPLNVQLIDESFGGIGVLVPSHIKLGKEVDIELSQALGGIRSVALVRHIRETESGNRVGLEWKALALSRYLRDVLHVGERSTRHRSLCRILPGGLSVMWKLYEGGRWPNLIDSADRLREEAANCHLQELCSSIDEFKQGILAAIQSQATDRKLDISEVIRAELDTLILKCIQAIS